MHLRKHVPMVTKLADGYRVEVAVPSMQAVHYIEWIG